MNALYALAWHSLLQIILLKEARNCTVYAPIHPSFTYSQLSKLATSLWRWTHQILAVLCLRTAGCSGQEGAFSRPNALDHLLCVSQRQGKSKGHQTANEKKEQQQVRNKRIVAVINQT